MLVRLLLITILIIISLFCWLSLLNPLYVEFQFFGRTLPTDLSTLMISSFVLGAMLVFIGTLARDLKRGFQNLRQSRKKKRELSIREELNRGIEYYIRGDLQKAKSHFIEVLNKDPSQINIYFKLSELGVKEGNLEEALNWLERARWYDMRNVDILLKEAELYQRMNRLEDAIRILNLAISINETNIDAHKSLRQIYMDGGKWDEALRIQKSIIKMTRGKQVEEETIFYLGLKYEYARKLMSRGGEENLERALKEAKEIVKERKTFEPGFVLLGDIYLRLGKWNSAGKVWRKSFQRFKSIIFILRLEDLYLGREDPNPLLHFYQKALTSEPENWMVAFFYAKLCLRLEMLDEALEEINEISLSRRDFPALHRLLAEIYLHKKDFNRAAQEFEKTFEMSKTSYLPFSCSVCDREVKEWIAYCPQCHNWSTYTIKEDKMPIPLTPLTSPSYTERPFFTSV